MSNRSNPAVRATREIAQWLLEIKFGLRVVALWFSQREDTKSVPYPHELMEEDDTSVRA